MEDEMLVVGGGVAGLAAAMELADAGHHVHLVEKEETIGGRAVEYSCKATDRCSKCNLCLALDVIREVRGRSDITLHTSSVVDNLQGSAGKYSVRIRCRESGRALATDVGAVVLATGFRPFPAETMSWYGYGRLDGVMSAYDLERELISSRRGVRTLLDGAESVAFLQCVGSRDEQTKNTYCSRICCMYALRLARLIKHECPEVEIDIFYMDLQGCGKDWKTFLQESREAGIEFRRGKATKVESAGSGRLQVIFEDLESGGRGVHETDRAVLSVGVTPDSENAVLGRRLGVNRDLYGFFRTEEAGDNVSTTVPGVFVAGTCQGPRDIAESMAHGRKAAFQASSLLRGRSVCETA